MKPKSSSLSFLIHQSGEGLMIDTRFCSLFARHHIAAACCQKWNGKQQVSLFELLPTPFSLPPKLKFCVKCYRLCLPFHIGLFSRAATWKVTWNEGTIFDEIELKFWTWLFSSFACKRNWNSSQWLPFFSQVVTRNRRNHLQLILLDFTPYYLLISFPEHKTNRKSLLIRL